MSIVSHEGYGSCGLRVVNKPRVLRLHASRSASGCQICGTGRLEVLEEGIRLPLFADGRGGAVAGEDTGVLGEREEAIVDGTEELRGVASG